MLHATPIVLTAALIRSAADYSVFVGDLAPDVTDYALQEHFRQFFASVRSAKVLPCSLYAASFKSSIKLFCEL